MRPVHRTMVLALPLVCLGAPRLARAQAPQVRVGGRIQVQYLDQAGDSTTNYNPNLAIPGFSVRRLRIHADVQVGERVAFTIMPSFEMASLRMRDAFMRVALVTGGPVRLGLTAGQEKKPFSRYELISSNNLVVIERGAVFRGFTNPPSQNSILVDNGYVSHDLGASLDLALPGGRVQLKAGIYNGSGESANDVNRSKTWGARLTSTLMRDGRNRPLLRAGAALLSRDRGVTSTAVSSVFHPDSSRRTGAFGLEAEWGDFRPGLHVVADYASGRQISDPAYRFDTGRNLGNVRGDTPASALTRFRSLHVVTSWRFEVAGAADPRAAVRMVEPAVRFDLTDPDTRTDNTGGVLVTPALSIHFTQTALLRAALDHFRYHDATGVRRSVRALRFSWQANF
jgi:hypothetical protein